MSGGHYGIDFRKNSSEQYFKYTQSQSAAIRIPTPNKTNIFGPMPNYSSQSNKNNKNQINQKENNIISVPPTSPAFDIERQYELIENMLANFGTLPFNTSIEQTLIQLLGASNAYVWINYTSINTLYSSTLSKACKYQTSIVGFCFRSKKIIYLQSPSNHEAFNLTIDIEDSYSIYIPLLSADTDTIFGVAQVIRDSSWLPFSEEEEEVAHFFAKKFSQLSHLFARTYSEINFNNNVIHASNQHLFKQLFGLIVRQFRCKIAEFWIHDDVSGSYTRFEFANSKINNSKFTSSQEVGVVESIIKTGSLINSEDISKLPGYSLKIDGPNGESILAVPIRENSQTVCIMLKGRGGQPSFGAIEANQLESLAPIITRSVLLGGTEKDDEDMATANFALKLKALLEVAEIISGVLDIDVLIPTIMKRACELMNTERCSLFLVDSNKQELVSRFHGGLEKSIRLPINMGIVGHTATTGNIVNITEAYNDPRFNKNVDLATGFRTRTILTVPIYNNRGEIGGVTEMINRIDGQQFDEDDIKMMKAFNVFCGISLDNAKLYQSSLDLTRQLRGFFEISSALNKTKSVRDVIEGILENAQVVIHASRASVFLNDKDGVLSQFVSIGHPTVHGTTFAEIVAKEGKHQIFNKEDIIKYHQNSNLIKSGQLGGLGPKRLGTLSRLTSVLMQDDDIFAAIQDQSEAQYESICGFPLFNNEGKLLGVMEMSCSYRILIDDLKLLDCFAVFAAVSLEKAELQDIAKFGKDEMQLKQYIADDERRQFKIPQKLVISPEDSETIYTINFDAPQWAGIGFFKIVYRMFDTFHLLDTFKIPAETMFRFLSEISETYNPVPYHNWRHAVDVTQFISYELITGHLEEKLPKFDLFALLTAAVCHDANHDGFSNVFNEKAETPLGILFKNQSVMETHHCSVSIGVLSKAENNIFAGLSSAEYKRMWTLIIQLILWTDMAKHFDFLKQANAEMDKGELDMSNDEHRLIMMRAVLKCGDVSNVSRPFELADKWCDVLCEEFFRQGDLEMAHGMEYTSPLNDREHLDKPKSQIGFYTFVCLPLFEVAARAVPELVVNCNQIRSNLEIWKKAAAEKEQKEKAEKEEKT